MIGHWPLDDGSGTVAIDLSSVGNHGSLEGYIIGGSCPTEDLDGDGVFALEDCDDTDATVTTGTIGSTIAGPTLTNAIGGWNDSGMRFTAVTSTTLTSVIFNNQGNSDTITLYDLLQPTLWCSRFMLRQVLHLMC